MFVKNYKLLVYNSLGVFRDLILLFPEIELY